MSDDIPELTGKHQDARRMRLEDVSRFLLGRARAFEVRAGEQDLQKAGRMLTLAVSGLTSIAERGDCSCPEHAYKVLMFMAEVIE